MSSDRLAPPAGLHADEVQAVDNYVSSARAAIEAAQPKKPRCYIAGPMKGYAEHNFPAFDKAKWFLQAEGWDVVSPADLTRQSGGPIPDGEITPAQYAAFMREDLAVVLQMDAVFVLPNWEQSNGARIEAFVARVANIPVLELLFSHNVPIRIGDVLTSVPDPLPSVGSKTASLVGNDSSGSVPMVYVRDLERQLKEVKAYNIELLTRTIPPLPVTSESVLQEADKIVGGARQKDYGHPIDNFGRVAELVNAYLTAVTAVFTKLTEEQVVDLLILLKIARLMNGHHTDSVMDIAGYAKVRFMITDERKKRESDPFDIVAPVPTNG